MPQAGPEAKDQTGSCKPYALQLPIDSQAASGAFPSCGEGSAWL